jgi:predicted Zn-dependent protease
MSYGYGYDYEPQEMRSPEPYQGLNLRVLAGLVIALIGVIIYMTHTEVNPVTGRRQHIAMSEDQEIRLGLEAAPKMASEMGGALDPAEDPRAREVALMGRRIVSESDASRSPYFGNYHFFLLNDPETVNAFALPGGQVFITRALYDKLEDEAELAGVLSHEVGHVVNRHAAEHMAQGRLGQFLTVAFGVGASGEGRGQRALLIASMVNQLAQLKFSRSDESEADSYGLHLMAQAGYDPSAMLDVMEILKEASKGGRQPEFLATHPAPETRLEEIRATLKQTYPNGIPRNLSRGRPLHGGFGRGNFGVRYSP